MTDKLNQTSLQDFISTAKRLGVHDELKAALKCNGVHALLELAFYEGFKCTHSQFNGELPFVVKEHTDDISCSTQIDEDPAVKNEYEHFLKQLKNG
jgi:hypothetical protein